MTPLRIFQKKDSEKKESQNIEKNEKKEKDEPLSEIKKEKAVTSGLKSFDWNVIKSPHITEKSAISEERGKYTFKIFKNANKIEVKKAIESIFNVKTEKVRIINIPNKKRQRGRVSGWKKGYKKAIVTLQKGYKIETLSK